MKFYELNEKGLANAQGITLIGIEIGSTMYSLDVLGAKIYAKRTGFPTVSGAGLRNSSIHIKYSGVVFKLRIDDVGVTALWPYDGARMETYKISYHEVGTADGGIWPNLCSIADQLPDEPVLDPHVGDNAPPGTLYGQNKWTLVVHEGERFVSASKTVNPVINKDWFTLGCAGHVLAKLPILRHSWITQGGAYPNTWQDRQAMLKMFSGDYCGHGNSYTFHGEPFVWIDARAAFSYAHPPLDLEARWGPGGAECLNDARLNRTTNPLASVYFPTGVTDAIKAECPTIPTCGARYGDVNPNHFFNATFNGANPN